MGVLQGIERRLQGAVGNAFARLFGGSVQPAEVASALQDEASGHVQRQDGRTVAPNRFVVRLGPSDSAEVGDASGRVSAAFGDMLAEYFDERGWDTFGRVTVTLEQSDVLHTGQFRISSLIDPDVDRRPATHSAGVGPMTQPPGEAPQQDPAYPYQHATGGQPAFGAPPASGGQPAAPYATPADPAYGPASGGQPGYQQASYGQPAYQQPGYGQPTYSQGGDGSSPDAGTGPPRDAGYAPGSYGQPAVPGYGQAPPISGPQPVPGAQPASGPQSGYGQQPAYGQAPPTASPGYAQQYGPTGHEHPGYPPAAVAGYDQPPAYPQTPGYQQPSPPAGYPQAPSHQPAAAGYDQPAPAGYEQPAPTGYEQPSAYPPGYGQPPAAPAYQQAPGYPQAPSPTGPAPAGYQPPPAAYQQPAGYPPAASPAGYAPAGYQPPPAAYQQPPGYPQAPSPAGYPAPAYQQPPDHPGYPQPPADLRAVLTVDDASGRTYQLQRGSNIIGRGQEASFRLPDTSVSRRHLDVYFDGQVAVMHDLGSTNGTSVNGSTVQTWQLADGDVIRVGHSTVIFHLR